MTSFHGWLTIEKHAGATSNRIVQRVKHALNKMKVGHAGTLDPLATGILPLAIGEATKVVSFLVNAEKEYRFEITWGEQRSTDDEEGEVIATSQYRPSFTEINSLISSFHGIQAQFPPLYSAKKIQGRRACDLIRQGHDLIKLNSNNINIKKFDLLEAHENKALFHIVCSKGTYVRALARDLGQKLGCYGYASKIMRTRVGPFSKESAISLEKLEECIKIGIVQEMIRPLQAVLDDIPAALVKADQAQKLRLGQAVVYQDLAIDAALSATSICICLTADNVPVALAQYMNGQLYPKRVFNLR